MLSDLDYLKRASAASLCGAKWFHTAKKKGKGGRSAAPALPPRHRRCDHCLPSSFAAFHRSAAVAAAHNSTAPEPPSPSAQHVCTAVCTAWR